MFEKTKERTIGIHHNVATQRCLDGEHCTQKFIAFDDHNQGMKPNHLIMVPILRF